ncbi:MAG: glycosyltransferase family 2 protein [Myxococcota bacterium]|nr:glycosyltransferase family 2 protein [Myxococcota bacterium]
MSAQPRSAGEAFVSVVVPVFNEAEVLPTLRERLLAVLADSSPRFEVIFVDDGSTDATADLVRAFHEEDPRCKGVHLSRNFGHQPAVTAGLAHASGDLACVMDADLQDPPEVLPRLMAEWEKGYDVVYAVRRERKERWAFVALAAFFYRLLARLSTIPMPLDAGDFCLVSRRVLDELNRLPEKERYVRGLRAWVGFRQTGVSYERSARRLGRSKYGLAGLARLALNGIVSFSDRPLLMVAGAGVIVSAAAFAYGLYLVALRIFFGGIVTGYASLMAAVLFLSGVQLVATGVLGLYLSKIFQEVKARPSYVVRETRGIGGPEEAAPGSAATR